MTTPTTPERRRRDGKSKFMALRETISREFAEGHTARAIYDRHLDQAGLSYSQFARYVARYVRTDDGPKTQVSPATAAAPAPPPVEPQRDGQQPDKPEPDRPTTGMGARFIHRAQPDDPNDLI